MTRVTSEGRGPSPPTGAVLRQLALAGAAWAAACAPSSERGVGSAEGAGPQGAPPEVHEPWPDEAAARGLTYVNVSGGREKRVILEANGAGVALLDLGGDGDLDVVFSQGCASLAALLAGPGADLAVYENDGAGHFEAAPGPGLTGWWTGLAAGDLDGDGDTDLVVGGYGGLAVLLQGADGRLGVRAQLLPEAERIVPGATRASSVPPRWTTSLALADLDGDGVLDLYAGHYLDLDPRAPPSGALGAGALAVPCEWRGRPVFCGPRGLPPQADSLWLGRGDGTFVDASATHLGGHTAGYTLGVLALDADGDGDADLFVANDSAPNLLLVNDGTGHMTDFGYAAGVALGPDGQMEAGMGVAAGDIDGDGRFDLVVTNFSDEPTRVLMAADVGFRDVTHRAGLQRATRALLSWGVHLADFDGDGALELFTANGHVHPAADTPGSGTGYGQADTLWSLDAMRDGGRALRAIPAATARSLLAPATGSRGTALGDVDGDGRPDLVVARLDGPAALGMNRFEGAHWLALRLVGTASPRDGQGAVVTLRAGGRAQRRAVTSSGSYQSSSSLTLHFGLGAREAYDALAVRWPSGHVDELGAGAGDRRLVVREGVGIERSEALTSAAYAGAFARASTTRAGAPARADAGAASATTADAREPALAAAARALGEDDLEGALALVMGPVRADGTRDVLLPDEPLAWLLAGRALARSAVEWPGSKPPSDARAAEARRAEADRCLERFVTLAPLDPEASAALHMLARHALERRDVARAEALRAEAERRKRWHEVFHARSEAKRAHPDAPEPRLALAELWRAVGHDAEARAELEALLARDPRNAEARARLAQIDD